jgi:hypothetical protein
VECKKSVLKLRSALDFEKEKVVAVVSRGAGCGGKYGWSSRRQAERVWVSVVQEERLDTEINNLEA